MKVRTYCASCGRPAEAPNRKVLKQAGWTVEWSKASQALFVQCAECSKKWLMEVTPKVMDDSSLMPQEHPMQHRKFYRAVPLTLFIVAKGKARHVIFARDAEEAVRLARKEGWFEEMVPVEVREFRWI